MRIRPRRRLVILCVAVACLAAAGVARSEPARAVPGEVLVRYRPGVRAADRATLRGSMGARQLGSFPFIDVEHLKLDGLTTEQAIARFASDPRVLYVEPNYEIHLDLTPSDSLFPRMYALNNTGQTGGTPGADIRAVNAWNVFTGDSTLKVGCIDSGIDYLHPDLAANIWTNPGEIPDNGIDDDGDGYVDDVHGYDFVNNDGDPMDDNGHGTHTAGTIAAVGNNGIGVTGVSWRAQLVAIKFLDAHGSGTYAGAIAAIQYAIRVGCRLTSNSWGGGGGAQSLLDAINASGEAGQLFVAAAGNSGQNIDLLPAYPASYNSPWIVSVAATDANDQMASFSSYGHESVDLAAPGVGILSTLPGGRYGLLSGTSMATPQVAGAVALAMGQFPSLSNLAIKAMLLNGADRLPQLNGTSVSGGRLNVFALVATPDSTPPGLIGDVRVEEPGSNTMTLAWTATGDDGATGRASRYDIRYATTPITAGSFAAATPVGGGPDPRPAGSPESFTVGALDFSTHYWFALRALDEFGNPGPVSNVVDAFTLGVPHIAVASDTIAATLATGGVTDRALAIANVGEGTLDFRLPPAQLVLQTLQSFAPISVAKGDDGPAGPVAVNGHGGPDAGGYRWIDSDEPAGPRFDWVEVSDAPPVILAGDDFLSSPLSLGFRFPFYGRGFDALRVCTNGFLSFTNLLPVFGNLPLPNPGAPENLIAPFWDDLDFGATPRVYARCEPTRCVIEYVGAPHYGAGGPYTFEVILYPTGEIRFQYLSMLAPLNSATIGLQDATQDIGLTLAFNTDYVHDSLAVKLEPLPQWVTVAPSSGRVHAGESLPVDVHLDATGLAGGSYAGTLRVESNDPVAPARDLPVALHVIGAPDLVLSPTTLRFDTVFVGAKPSRPLKFSNPGSDVLHVSAITASEATVTAELAAFDVARFDVRTLGVRWAPVTPGALDATLSLATNDPDTPLATVHVTGIAIPAPSFAVAPDSLSFALLAGGLDTGTLRVSNHGGSDLVFRANTLTGSADAMVQGDAENRLLAKGTADVLAGPAALDFGGPDGFGYTFRDSREADGPAFAWEDVRTSGVAVELSGDDAVSVAIPIGFSFPFYGLTFDSFRISTNGFVSFTSTAAAFSNTTLPNDGTGVPENLLAVFWDDLVFPAGRHAFVRTDGARTVIQFQDVARFNEGAYPNTFEIVLHASGEIEYRYLTVHAANPHSATVGLQDGTRTDGLQVVFNGPYLEDSLALRFAPPARWLTVAPRLGRVAPGEFVDLAVGVNGSGLFGGRYDGRVRIEGNDPLAPRRDIPVHLLVTGVPVAVADPAALDFGRVSIGEPRTLPLTVRNAGSDSLRVDKLTVSDVRFQLELDHLVVAPFAARVVGVTFAPTAPGAVPGQLEIRSNDPDHARLVVPIAATGALPERLAFSPDSVRAALATSLGDLALTGTRHLVIANPGGNDLTWSAEAVLGVDIASAAAPLEAEVVKGDVGGPGTLGAAGPDAGGYRWIDSDEPGGPPFDWVEIAPVGTPLPFDGDDQTSPSLTLPFRFDFYGTVFDSIRVCTNGWASFTSGLTTYTNAPLPNAGRVVPENLVAPFWDDQDFSPAVGSPSAYTWADSTRFVIAFYDVPHQGFGGTYSYEIVLNRDGTLDYQYLRMGTRTTEATIGIQNGDRTVGLQVAYNARYVHDRLRVHITRVPPWLAVSRAAGRVAPGAADTIEVRLRAAGLPDGIQIGSVRIESNDLLKPLVHVPVTLRIGVVPGTAQLTPRTLNLARGGPFAQLKVSVPGADPRRIVPSSLRINGVVGVAPGEPVMIHGDAATFRIPMRDLESMLTVGPVVLLVTGEVDGVTWFTARDTLQVLRPKLHASLKLHDQGSGFPIATVAAGEHMPLAWDPAAGSVSERWQVWCSNDGGASWTLGGETREPMLDWIAPGPATTSAQIEVLGLAGAEVTEAGSSDPFVILAADPASLRPRVLGLRLTGPNPAPGGAALELALPDRAAVDVRIYDVRGAVVRRLAGGTLEAGTHPLAWDGADAAGRPVRPGVYFVRALVARRVVTLRIALIR